MIYIWFWPAYKFATLSVFIALGVQVERRLLKKLIERNDRIFENLRFACGIILHPEHMHERMSSISIINFSISLSRMMDVFIFA